MADAPSSPANGSASPEEALAYYKAQYEQLESELADFQASSRELEAELEKDIDASEKRERKLQEKVESLGYEVEEWKTKYKQSKSEANSAQNSLQKEITTLRDSNRTLQLKLRDIEVANDDFERQARNTTSSLEDLESKYNVAIERGVMLEEEIKVGEQERETLRIESQRLRDELSDLRVEAEITLEKLRNAEASLERQREALTSQPISTSLEVPHSPISEMSPSTTAASSPVHSSPPRKSTSTPISDTATPPSPPVSETYVPAPAVITPLPRKPRPLKLDSKPTSRPPQYTPRIPRHSGGPSATVVSNGSAATTTTPAVGRRNTTSRPDGPVPRGIPTSSSLRQIRGLIGQMQRLEERVHSVRSKLPAPVSTPPGVSPRNGPVGSHIPSTVTVRSQKRRTGGSNASSTVDGAGEVTPLSNQNLKRLSFGTVRSSIGGRDGGDRPSSRASVTSYSSYSQHGGSHVRPSSRTSMSGTRTPLGHSSTASTGDLRRPRSSLAGNYSSIHNPSASISGIDEDEVSTPTQRRSTLKSDAGGSGIPTPSGLPRRQSGQGPTVRRVGSALGYRDIEGEMAPPRSRPLSGVGETY